MADAKRDHERIYLQAAYYASESRTWCQDRIDETDTEYIRADIAADRIEELEAKIGRLTARGIQDMQHEIATLDAENAALREDKARLDWLESQSTYALLPDRGWIARQSTTGRGFRLHETSIHGHEPTPRSAIDAARREVE